METATDVRMCKSVAGMTLGRSQGFSRSMCKLGKLNYVAGAEIAKRRLISGSSSKS